MIRMVRMEGPGGKLSRPEREWPPLLTKEE